MPDTQQLIVANNGPMIVSTNYWQTEAERAGKFLCSWNAGALRLLIPRQHQRAVREMRQARLVLLTRGPWPAMQLADAFELLFDDDSGNPWSLHLSPESFDRLPDDALIGSQFPCTAWIHLVGHRPRLAVEKPCYYRRATKLPHLAPHWT
jgi:hypothetical protein